MNRLTLIAIVLMSWGAMAFSREVIPPRPAPEFTQKEAYGWINSAPLTLAELQGQVILIDFWTFDCWNCYRSFPWLNALEKRYQDKGLRVIGIHSPEFEHEKDKASVVRKVMEFGLHHPVMMDNDFGYWRAIGNRYWPSYYLVDKQGRIRSYFIGETHEGDRRAKAIEAEIQRLLAES